MHRREFLEASMAAVASGAFREAQGQERMTSSSPINKRLKIIIEKLQSLDVIGDVQFYEHTDASKGLIKWDWDHAFNDMTKREIEHIEHATGELLTGMREVWSLPESGFTTLRQDAIRKGREEADIGLLRYIYRDMIRKHLSQSTPRVELSDMMMDRAMQSGIYLKHPIDVDLYSEFTKSMNHIQISPLALLGPGYVMSLEKNVKLIGAEDPYIYAMAEVALHHGTREQQKKWIDTKREENFISDTRNSPEDIQHLQLGKNHDLTDNVKKSNEEHPEKISLVTVRVKSLVR